jgi:hypothetical protein
MRVCQFRHIRMWVMLGAKNRPQPDIDPAQMTIPNDDEFAPDVKGRESDPPLAEPTAPFPPQLPAVGRYVVLRHETPPDFPRPSHYDLMLESGPELATWAVAAMPEAGEAVIALRLPGHRIDYLDYEGPVSGGRGTVARFQAGTFQVMHRDGSGLTLHLTPVGTQQAAVYRLDHGEGPNDILTRECRTPEHSLR